MDPIEWRDDLDSMQTYEDDLDADALDAHEEAFIRGFEAGLWL